MCIQPDYFQLIQTLSVFELFLSLGAGIGGKALYRFLQIFKLLSFRRKTFRHLDFAQN